MPGVGDIPPRKSAEAEEEGAPLWMVTMSDMNTLLMTFFIILFSLLVIERDKYRRVKENKEPRSLTDPVAVSRLLDAEPNLSLIFSGWEPGRTERPTRPEQVMEVGRVRFRISKTPSGTVVTVGGEFHSFLEGGWELNDEHRAILDEFLQWMGPQKHRLLVRGFTAGNWEDSVVREGESAVPYARSTLPGEERAEKADHWLLASLRARHVRRYLVAGTLDEDGRRLAVDPRRIEVQIDAYNERVADNLNQQERHKNRRVEMVILPYE